MSGRGPFRRVGLVIAWTSIEVLAARAEARVETRIIDSCTMVESWRVERGKLSVDAETFASGGASIRVEESGVYERVAPVERCQGFSLLVRASARRPVKVVGHLRDRDGGHYVLETRSIDPGPTWKRIEYPLESAALAPWSMDLNHHLDFPLSSVGVMVSLSGGDTVNLDRLAVTEATGPTEREVVLREETRAWSSRLSKRPAPVFRQPSPTAAPIALSRDREDWVVTAPYYRARIGAGSGTLRTLEFGPGGSEAVSLESAHPWEAISWEGEGLAPGRLGGWEWEPKLRYLLLRYEEAGGVGGELRYLFRGREIEAQLLVRNASRHVIRWVRFPGEMEFPAGMVRRVFWPRLGGVELLPSFFRQGRFTRAAYPADGFADWTAFDLGRRTLAVGTVQAGPCFQSAEPALRGKDEGRKIGYVHDVSVFITPGSSWAVCPVVFWLAERPENGLSEYRKANGWEASPPLRKKLPGDLFDRMSRSPLLKWDFDALSRQFGSGRDTFSNGTRWARGLPGRFLIHPVAYWNPPGRGPRPNAIFDQNHPNFLPAAERMGGDAGFRAFLRGTRSEGHLVAPYTNPTAWGRYAKGFEEYGEDIAILSEQGLPHRGWEMYSADAYEPRVRAKTSGLAAAFAGSHRVDLIFEDQVGARGNYLNLRQRTPHPTAYTEGWIEHARKMSEILPLMTERGFDALIPYEAAFCGIELGLSCTRFMPGWEWNGAYGEGNWRVFPVDSYLCHDKCALYHHDLGQAVLSDSDLAWSLVKGYNLQTHFGGDRKWTRICQAFQESVGPFMFGEPLRGFEYLSESVIEARFPRLRVMANFHPEFDFYLEGNHSIPPNGVFVLADGGRLRAGVVKHFHGVAFEQRRYLMESHAGKRLEFRDVFPSGETYRLQRHVEWAPGQRIGGEAVTARGRFPVTLRELDGFFEFTYPAEVRGEPILRLEFYTRD